MVRHQIICSPCASARLDAALGWIAPRLNGFEVLIIGATRIAADEFARPIFGPVFVGRHCLSLIQDASEITFLSSAELGFAITAPDERTADLIERTSEEAIHMITKFWLGSRKCAVRLRGLSGGNVE